MVGVIGKQRRCSYIYFSALICALSLFVSKPAFGESTERPIQVYLNSGDRAIESYERLSEEQFDRAEATTGPYFDRNKEPKIFFLITRKILHHSAPID